MKNISILFIISCFTFQLSIAQYEGYSADSWKDQLEIEEIFAKQIDKTSFKKHLKKLTERPHVVGSAANEEVQRYIGEVMQNAGLVVTNYPYDLYLPKEPGTSLIEIITPSLEVLNQKEGVIPGDKFSEDPLLWKGWNAFSGSGDVTAEVVYANYGRKEDFETLKRLGVDVKGKIVLARYGGNFRGFKAKFAEANGASGLIIFTDPKDSGFTKGLVYPEGPYYNSSTIQRGSLLTSDFTGDPLTPFEPALPLDGKKKIKRLDPKDAQLHTIPVTPIGYGEAEKILGKMEGKVVPQSWQGGLPFTYRLDGGNSLTVRLKVDQKIDFVRATNVIGMIKGSEAPDEWIILGCHLDAWGFGATDPNSGTAMLLSLSETLGSLIDKGYNPKRSILIGHWDAEEHGVIGSSEWVEQMRDELNAKGVVYMNFDGGVSGKNFGASAAPTLKKLMVEASKVVKYPYTDQSLFEFWKKDNQIEPSIGSLGGGSDHIAFYMHAGVPSLSGGAGGPNLYHSNYDSFRFYKQFVDPEFKMGPMVEQMAGLMALRMANAELIPYNLNRYAVDLKIHFSNAETKIKEYDQKFEGFKMTADAIESLEKTSDELTSNIKLYLESGKFSKKELHNLNQQLIALEKSFISDQGMYFGSWFKSLYASSDPFSGYAAWILPGLEYEIALKSSNRLQEWDSRYANAVESLHLKMKQLIEDIK
ncbi:MAG: M28 family peptidase [Cryomorphaceae bacterium]|jgi:N-acetylated-alpha-linked acidic dipeptidase|nr:M28 family peptidase [Cryomorphaceae bacterium]MBT4222809.1 M28 family peptidase [Cryomorphaceae bacterium]MBT4293370.1 M28 family peptidase [Cryomorphaceae bacterium]MBT4517057.1 M28 family peptidase [Cryomorphaceae bacterium]MBT4834163.1 M28 family peptidase [Cryomorphaceae bacterium]